MHRFLIDALPCSGAKKFLGILANIGIPNNNYIEAFKVQTSGVTHHEFHDGDLLSVTFSDCKCIHVSIQYMISIGSILL